MVAARIDVAANLTKLRMLETLIRATAEQRLDSAFRAEYVRDAPDLDKFTDGRSFERLGKGDCGDAVVHTGGALRRRGIVLWPALRQFPMPRGRRQLHAILYSPPRGIVVDPTFLIFPMWRGKRPVLYRVHGRDRADLDRQVCRVHGACALKTV